jgi:hypothetical protein
MFSRMRRRSTLSQVNICRRFLELRDLKNEIGLGACSGVAWAPELQPSIVLLRRRIVSLQEQIWCYRSACIHTLVFSLLLFLYKSRGTCIRYAMSCYSYHFVLPYRCHLTPHFTFGVVQ